MEIKNIERRRRRFQKLRTRSYEYGYTQEDLADIRGKSRTYIARRFAGIEPWSTEDMKVLGPMLNIPFDDWLYYFVDEDIISQIT